VRRQTIKRKGLRWDFGFTGAKTGKKMTRRMKKGNAKNLGEKERWKWKAKNPEWKSQRKWPAVGRRPRGGENQQKKKMDRENLWKTQGELQAEKAPMVTGGRRPDLFNGGEKRQN